MSFCEEDEPELLADRVGKRRARHVAKRVVADDAVHGGVAIEVREGRLGLLLGDDLEVTPLDEPRGLLGELPVAVDV